MKRASAIREIKFWAEALALGFFAYWIMRIPLYWFTETFWGF